MWTIYTPALESVLRPHAGKLFALIDETSQPHGSVLAKRYKKCFSLLASFSCTFTQAVLFHTFPSG